MTKEQTRIAIFIILLVNAFVIWSGIYFHEVPYWALALISNAVGLLLGYILAAVIESRREYVKKYGKF